MEMDGRKEPKRATLRSPPTAALEEALDEL